MPDKRADLRAGISYKVGQVLVQLSDKQSSRIVFSLALGTTVGVMLVIAHEALIVSLGTRNVALVGDAFVVAIVVFLLTLAELSAVQERRKRVLREMRNVGELNHHVRNALAAIQYAAYASKDQTNLDIVTASIERIDWILKELFPVLGEPVDTRRSS